MGERLPCTICSVTEVRAVTEETLAVRAVGSAIGTDPAKCQQVRDWPVPRDLHEVRSFVGLCSYYRRHIQGFTELAAPLYELATKGTDFEWTERRHEAFGQLKNALTSAPILGFPQEDGH